MGQLAAGLPNLGLWWYVVAAALAPIVMGVVWVRAMFFEAETQEEKERKELSGLAWLKASLNWEECWADDQEKAAMGRLVATIEAGDEMERALLRGLERAGSGDEEVRTKGVEAVKAYRGTRETLVASFVEAGK